jgi:hypothetical protein
LPLLLLLLLLLSRLTSVTLFWLLLLLLLRQESNLAEHIRCVRLLGLTPDQQQQIADGFAVFSRLLEPVLQVGRQQQRLGGQGAVPAAL